MRFVAEFSRFEVTVDEIKSLCSRKGWKTGRDGRFVKGQEPANKGKKMPYNANSARTRFKKGATPPNRLPLWSERVGKDGYVEIKVPERNPHTGSPTWFRHKHVYLWEQANGPVPKGHCLKSIDGDRINTDPANWMAIPRAMLPRLSGRWTLGYDDAPDELKPFLLAVAKLEQLSRDRRKAAADA